MVDDFYHFRDTRFYLNEYRRLSKTFKPFVENLLKESDFDIEVHDSNDNVIKIFDNLVKVSFNFIVFDNENVVGRIKVERLSEIRKAFFLLYFNEYGDTKLDLNSKWTGQNLNSAGFAKIFLSQIVNRFVETFCKADE